MEDEATAMTRSQHILKLILDQLARWDGEPADEVLLHAAIDARIRPEAGLSELRDMLQLAEAEGWVAGIVSALHGKRWAITDKGRAARLA